MDASAHEIVAGGVLRQELAFQLQKIVISAPVLRERSDDILQLAAHFMALVAEHLDKKVPSLSSEAEVALKRYAWPGNVREWEHCVSGAVVAAERATLNPADLAME